MNIFMVYRQTKEGTIYEISEDGNYKKMTPEEIPMYISDIIKKVRQSTFVYVRGLNKLKYDIIKVLYAAGVNFVEGNPKFEKMGDLDCKTLIGGDIPKVYHLTIKNHNKKIQLIDLDNLLPECDEVLKSWGRHEALAYVKAYERGLTDLHDICRIKRKKPLTVAGATRGLLKKLMPDFAPVDVSKEKINDNQTFDDFIRKSYRGGLCIYKQRDYINHEGEGISLDVHSMYPYVMVDKPLPISGPKYNTGKPSDRLLKMVEKGEKAIFLHITASFELKEKCVPCVRCDSITTKNEWLENSYLYRIGTGETIKTDKEIDLTLTYMDYIDFLNNYEIFSIHYIDYVTMDCARKGLFVPIVKPLYHKKRRSEGGERKMAKIILNSISGTVAMRNEYENYAIKIIDENISFEKMDTSVSKSYIYMGSYITSWARHILIDLIRKNYDRWIYSDTDCLFLKDKEIPDGLKIGEGLGQFAIDKDFDDLIIYKQKMYGYVKDGKVEFTLAGVQKKDIDRLPTIMDDEKIVFDELYTKGNCGYDLREKRDKLEQKMVDEMDIDFEDRKFYNVTWKRIIKPVNMTREEAEKFKKMRYKYDDLCADIVIFTAQLKKRTLLDLIPYADLPMTREEFEDFSLKEYAYKMNFSSVGTYA